MRRWAAYLLAIMVLAAASSPGAAAQPKRVFRIGVLSPAGSPSTKLFDAFRKALHGLGYIDGENISIEYRLSAGDYSRLPAMAADLVRLPVDVIVTDSGLSTRAAREATREIPIVAATAGADPVAARLVWPPASLVRAATSPVSASWSWS
jgi:putative tryptophan/tyrosine transport system substrate-binding protein